MSPSYFLPVNSLTIANRIVTGSLSRTRGQTHEPDPALIPLLYQVSWILQLYHAFA